MTDDNPRLRRFARRMRREPTPAEEALWRLLRHRRLAGFKFRRQHTYGPYILDFYCPRARLVVELDGDTHATPEGLQADAERSAYLEARGLVILRFWNTEVADDQEAVLTRIVEERIARTGEGMLRAIREEPAGSEPPTNQEPPISDA